MITKASNEMDTTQANEMQSRSTRGTQTKEEPTLDDIVTDVTESLSAYAKKRPEVVAMWSFGVGFVLAWKLKPW